MKANIRFLNLLFRFTKLTPEMFYSIAVTEQLVSLQGQYNPDLVIILNKLKLKMAISEHGYLYFQKSNSNFKITLT